MGEIETALMKLLGFKTVPCTTTLGGWLQSVIRNPKMLKALEEANRQLLAVTLGDRKTFTLDIDAAVIRAKKKKEAKRTYKNHRGYVPIFGHIAETGQLVQSELREGNVPPAAQNVELFHRCRNALPEGIRVNRFRADAHEAVEGVISVACHYVSSSTVCDGQSGGSPCPAVDLESQCRED